MTTFSPQYEDVLQKAMQLSADEQAALVQALGVSFQTSGLSQDLQQMPLSPNEAIAQNLTGTWDDLIITDGAEWINEQKAKQQAKRQW